MGRLFKWGFWGFVGVVALTAIASLFLVALAARSVQPSEGRMDMAGLSGPVTVTRDANGIPHISAQTRADAVQALGFSHAQDRLWQMDFLRMTGQGRLSEILGVNEDVQNIDVFLRTLGFAEQVSASIEIMRPDTREILEAYARGVNAFLQRDLRLAEPGLPPEFLIMGHKPEPWKAEHSLLIFKILSLQLSMNMDRELKRLQLAAQGLSNAEINDIMPFHRDESPPSMPDLRTLYQLQAPETADADLTQNKYAGVVDQWSNGLGLWASNNWVLSGAKTKSGKPLLANDPHLAFGAPSLWYLAHLSWPDGKGGVQNLIGATVPSMPTIVLGRNNNVAWGFTNAGADVQDLYVERVNPDDKTEYFSQNGWLKFQSRTETIKVKGGADLVFERKLSRHGPVLPRSFKKYGKLLGEDFVLALQWTGLSRRDTSFEVLSDVSLSNTVDEFGQRINQIIAPMQAIVVADKAGNVGLFAKSKLPLRKPNNQFHGRAPMPGWLIENEWAGYVPVEQQLHIVNPVLGALGTGNSKLTNSATDPFYTFDWDEPFRQDRVLRTMVNANKKLSAKDMIAGQTDIYSAAMIAIRDEFLEQMEPRPRHAALLSQLRNWNGMMAADRTEPLVLVTFMRHAMIEIFKDDLAAVFDVTDTAPAVSLLRVLRQGGARDWCDRRDTEARESCDQILGQAFDLTLVELTEKFGAEPESWKWGKAHIMTNAHSPFSKVGILSKLFNIDRAASGGSYTLLRAKTKLAEDSRYRAVHGAGYRAIYDFSDLDNSLYVQSTGQSGNLMSSLYSNLSDKWIDGKYLQMSTRPDDYRKNALGVWKLSPK